LIELDRRGDNNAAVLNTNHDGTRLVQEIDFAGKKYALDFRSMPAGSESMSQTDNN